MKSSTILIQGALLAFFAGGAAFAQATPGAAQRPATAAPAAAQPPQQAGQGAESPLQPALAQPVKVDPQEEAAIRHLMDITEVSKMGEVISGNISTNVRSIMGRSMPQDRLAQFMTDFDQKFRTHAPQEKLADMMVPIYARYFSNDDIQGLIQFYQSPLGQRVMKTLPQVMREAQNTGVQYEKDAALSTLTEMSDQYPELKPMLGGPQAKPPAGAAAPAAPAPAKPAAPGAAPPPTPHK